MVVADVVDECVGVGVPLRVTLVLTGGVIVDVCD